jgi:type IV pilus assembly protein PilB
MTAQTPPPQRSAQPLRPLERAAQGSGLNAEAPVVRYLDALLEQAVTQRASDIHVEPQADGLRVRWRIDGRLAETQAPPAAIQEALVSRIKVLAKLDISERRLPQDGHIKQLKAADGRAVDLRISTLPTIHGEKVVIRVLDHDAATLSLEQLGMEAAPLAALKRALSQPHGMILVTGPTGSGKTVTLYSCLQRLNRPEVNIATVEDPAEIRLPGITQVNVNEKAGLQFAPVLRAMLRQDPDIIMVGEVRDGETADIAIKAAQTGHLVLSTLHTNDAPSSLSRLVNMGVPSFQVATTVSLICAQRLVRRLCDHCKAPAPISAAARQALGGHELEPAQLWFKAVGCAHCIGGYRGRIGVFQVMPVSEAMANAMIAGRTSHELAALAQQEQVLTLRQAAIRQAVAGLTSIEEVLMQTRED